MTYSVPSCVPNVHTIDYSLSIACICLDLVVVIDDEKHAFLYDKDKNGCSAQLDPILARTF